MVPLQTVYEAETAEIITKISEEDASWPSSQVVSPLPFVLSVSSLWQQD